jgi:hypothetical protein
MAENLDAVARWLESVGFAISPTRVGVYRRHLALLANAPDAGSIGHAIAKEGVSAIVDSLFESNELCLIHRALEPIADPEVKARLASFIKGPIAYRDEKASASSNRARNIGFELRLGAHLLNAGLPVEFHPEGDLRFPYRNYEFFVECKRPQVGHQVNSRVKDALKQLSERYRGAVNPESARGIVAVSITKVVNPFGESHRTPTQDTLAESLSTAAQRFLEEHRPKWQRPADPRTLGCILDNQAFVFVESDSRPTTGGDIVVTACDDLGAKDAGLFESLMEMISKGIKPSAP